MGACPIGPFDSDHGIARGFFLVYLSVSKNQDFNNRNLDQPIFKMDDIYNIMGLSTRHLFDMKRI